MLNRDRISTKPSRAISSPYVCHPKKGVFVTYDRIQGKPFLKHEESSCCVNNVYMFTNICENDEWFR